MQPRAAAAVRGLLAAGGRTGAPLAVSELNQTAIPVDCAGYSALAGAGGDRPAGRRETAR